MELSIVIPVKDDVKIKECIKSIDEDVEIIVAMNDPSNEIINIVKELDVKSICILEANLSKAYNAGIEAASFDRVLLMDSDCTFERGTIKKLYEGSLCSKLSKGRVVFRNDTFGSKIVSKVREYTTSDFCNAFSPPLILNKIIIEDIGYYFNPLLKWEEDYDFNKRVFEKGIKIFWDKSAIVYHPPLSIKSDLKSAYNYGVGHGIGLKAGIFNDYYEGQDRKIRKRIIKEQYKILKRQKGFFPLIYYIFWKKAYKLGIRNSYSCK